MNRKTSNPQARRCANLRHLSEQLTDEGVLSLAAQGEILGGLTEQHLRALLAGEPMSYGVAREIEWTMQRPVGWLDAPRTDVLDN